MVVCRATQEAIVSHRDLWIDLPSGDIFSICHLMLIIIQSFGNISSICHLMGRYNIIFLVRMLIVIFFQLLLKQ